MRLPNPFRDWSIRFKLYALLVFCGGLALLLAGVFLQISGRQGIRQGAVLELKTEGEIICDGVTAALTFGDEKAATEILTTLREDRNALGAAVYDARGSLFASWERSSGENPGDLLPAPPPGREHQPGSVYGKDSGFIWLPITFQGRQIGTLAIRETLKYWQYYERQGAVIADLALLGALGLSLLGSSRLLRTITRPLARLSQLAKSVSMDRDYSVRAERLSGDEIGVLVDSFNEMLAQIGARDEALRESEERFALAARGANDGLWDWKASTGLMYMSARGNQILGLPDEEHYWKVEDWNHNLHPSDQQRVASELRDLYERRCDEWNLEYRVRHASGASVWISSRGRAVMNAAGAIVRIAGSLTDITAGKVADALTGLNSRFYFLDRLENAIETASEAGSSFAVLFLDLDRFKLVNDSLGHAAGDELLVEVARRLRFAVHSEERIGAHSVVARLGGDEFAVLLCGVSQREAEELAERILGELSAPFRLGSRQMFPGVSIGIAMSNSGQNAADLLRNADTAMYQAKQSGRGRVEVFDEEMRNRAMARMEIEAGLRQAIAKNQLVVFYQPQVLVAGGRMHGFEALVRWQHPERGLIPPIEFISIAEESDLIVSLGRWVLEEACRQMAKWQGQFHLDPPLTMSVNVSYKQLRDPGFIDDVRRVLRESGLEPHSLRLEMTESILMADGEEPAATLRQLKDIGIGLEIDDFGTGYSSLSCLKSLPFDTVKIDRSFVRELGGSRDATEIVRAILDLAGSMTMDVIAEGVETEAQLRELSSLGCSLAQGYLFSRPVKAGDAAVLLEDEVFSSGMQHLGMSIREGQPTEEQSPAPVSA